MIKRSDVTARKLAVMKQAAARWQEHAPDVAATAAMLARVGPLAAASPEQRARYVARETAKAAVGLRGWVWERKVGDTLDFDDLPPTASALDAGRPIARLVELIDRQRVGEGFATGFLVSGPLLVTNWHVFGDPDEARGCGAQFGYQRNAAGGIDAGVVFELDPAGFFHSDEALDLAVVGITRAPALGSQPLDSYGHVRLIPSVGKILAGQPVSIIQHPDGGHKRWAIRDNTLVREPGAAELFLEYTTDTLPGSSGSPAFNKDWELVAIHHSGVPRMQGDEVLLRDGSVWRPGIPDSAIDWVANEGVRVSKVHAHLQSLTFDEAERQHLIERLLTGSTDPLETGELQVGTDVRRDMPASGGFNVVVHGTANFFVNQPDGRAPLAPGPSTGADGGSIGAVTGPVTAPPSAERKLRFDPDYAHRPGYDPGFLPGFTVPAPTAPLDETINDGDEPQVLHYHHYSVVMHRSRRFCLWAASNVNYDKAKRWRSRTDFGSDTWKLDPRVLGERQIDDVELYDPARKFDQGHIVRRDDVAWGETKQEEEFGNSDSFHFTNCTPQHEEFNRAAFGFRGLWGALENHIARQAGMLKDHVIVFAGPTLLDDDPVRDFGFGTDIQVPIEFWKVVVAVEDPDGTPTLRAFGFMLSQREAIELHGWERRFQAGRFREQQVALPLITERSRIVFPQIVLDADILAHQPHEAARRTLRRLDDIRLRP